ncbi:MAG: phosphoenolpyruvate carboxylase [Marinicaulis sp.]|nr:phosphoenolpyruvate carboxylase [Marinicaulis sp.]
MTTASPAPPSNENPAADWIGWCQTRLDEFEVGALADPMTNSVRRLAHELFEIQKDGGLSSEKVDEITAALSGEALIDRAERFADTHPSECNVEAAIDDVLRALNGKSFDEVRNKLSSVLAGIVFTAHPTFAMSRLQCCAVADYASAKDEKEKAEARELLLQLPHRPDVDITLDDEHAAVRDAISRAKAQLRSVSARIFNWAKEHYPENWTELSPAILSVASWVGYDLDGRTDIHWGQSFRFRIEEKSRQLHAYAYALSDIDCGGLNDSRDDLTATLIGAAQFAAEQASLFAGDLTDGDQTTAAANLLTGDDERRLTSLESVVQSLNKMIRVVSDNDAKTALCILRTEMRNYGLGESRIHFRVNAAQVRSALRADLGIDDDRQFFGRSAIETAAKKAEGVKHRKINIASIFLEQMTARRQLMLCAQILKHVDADAPIRFLIAECEAPATLMGAVYLARLYGVEDRIDISPLFETPEAMERGGRFIERLLGEEEYVDYIRKRGRISVQIGFSDSGRFMGQIAANLAIERLQILFARSLAAKDIRDVEVLIFNTHGESMGRGGFPGSLTERFDYLMTPWVRARYKHEALRLNVESSFQGGDGFLHFATDGLASATVGAMLKWAFTDHNADRSDKYYSELNYSWDFYRGIKSWQEQLFEDPDYQRTIGAFAPQLLSVTGSRKSRRQSGAAITGPRSLRAIPHNAILQQLATPANITGGVGVTAGAEPDRALDHVENSARMRQIMAMLRASRRGTSLPVLRAYAAIFNASYWISKATVETAPSRASAFEEIAIRLRGNETAVAINRLADHYAVDLAKLDRIFVDLDGDEYREARHRDRRLMHILHACRQALIMRGLTLVADVPSFSQRHDITRSTLFDYAFTLRFDDLSGILAEIFPADELGAEEFKGIEEESDDGDGASHGYPEIHENIIAPLKQIHQELRDIGVGLSHFYNAYG